jgi:DNA-directed RNA polymerase subunit F
MKTMEAKYANVFNSPEGREVLADLLAELNFFNTCETQEQVALSNFAKSILMKMGKWHPENIRAMVDDIMNLPTKAIAQEGDQDGGSAIE